MVVIQTSPLNSEEVARSWDFRSYHRIPMLLKQGMKTFPPR